MKNQQSVPKALVPVTLHEGQWYALPNGRWTRATQAVAPTQQATAVTPRLAGAWTLELYGWEATDGWTTLDLIDVQAGGAIEVPGTLGTAFKSTAATIADLREAQPDEAAALDASRRSRRRPQFDS